ncbi:MAG: capsular polysaccharide biosynthesis protein [Pseudobutyrivibrio sp.]|nr:capsular polysaccharide biosynthesis protein [Pseudobutyrivibrio sp.]
MIDFHSHFLPGIDDGSDSIETSIAMLNAWYSQGITDICATPHFYAEHNNPERFISRRNKAFAILQSATNNELQNIRLGAEVLFFDGISRYDGLHELCLEGTDLLLLEMPFRTWTSHMIEEVGVIASTTGIMPVAAHIERYLDQPRKLLKEFLNLNIFIQSNAEFFLDRHTQRKALKMLKKGTITFLGTDAHNLGRRSVNLGPAIQVIDHALGSEYINNLDNLQRSILSEYSSTIL